MKTENKYKIKYILSYIYNGYKMLRFNSFGKGSYIGKNLTLNKSPKSNLIIGKRVRIGNHARFSLYGDNSNIHIHDSVYAGSNISIITSNTVVIEQDVLLASYISIIGHNHGIDPDSNISYGKQDLIGKPILIKEGSWIGERVCILPGVTIGKKSIVGCGAIVTNDIPDYAIAVGNPAKIIKKYNKNLKIWEVVDSDL